MDVVTHPQTILAYEMNGEPLTIEHGAPLRLRCETQLGFKMVKYLCKIKLSKNTGTSMMVRGFREDIQCFVAEVGI